MPDPDTYDCLVYSQNAFIFCFSPFFGFKQAISDRVTEEKKNICITFCLHRLLET